MIDPESHYVELEEANSEGTVVRPPRGLSKKARYILLASGVVVGIAVLIVVIVVATSSDSKDKHPNPKVSTCQKENPHCTCDADNVCNCDTGYKGDGAVCVAASTCQKEDPHCTCDADNVCNCDTGYKGDGAVCVVLPSIPACHKGNSHCTVCDEKDMCVCEAGYRGDGTECLVEPLAQAVLAMIDEDASVCTSWRDYACGGWMATAEVPADDCLEGSCENDGMFAELQTKVDEEMAQSVAIEGPAQTMYALCMKTDIVNDGLRQLLVMLAPILDETTKWGVMTKAVEHMMLAPLLALGGGGGTLTMKDPKTGLEIEDMPVMNAQAQFGVPFTWGDDDEQVCTFSDTSYIHDALMDLKLEEADDFTLSQQVLEVLRDQPLDGEIADDAPFYTVAELQAVIDSNNLGDTWDWEELLGIYMFPSNPYFRVQVKNLTESYKTAKFLKESVTLEALKASYAFLMYGAVGSTNGGVFAKAPPPASCTSAVSLEDEVLEVMSAQRDNGLSRHEMQHKLMGVMHRRVWGARGPLEHLRVKSRWRRLNRQFRLDSLRPVKLPAHINTVDALKAHLALGDISTKQGMCRGMVEDMDMMTQSFLKAADWGEASKKRALDMMEAVKAALKGHIEVFEWMDEQTRTAALKKLDYIQLNAGYPDDLVDYSQGIDMTGFPDILSIWMAIAKNMTAPIFSKFGVFPDFKFLMWTAGFISPTTVNAMYAPMFNTITVPAAILQNRVFGGTHPAALNFGAAGAIIGHELTHGFDNSGKEYDEYGRERNWWTPSSEAGFTTRADCLVNEYNNYTCCTPEVHIHGEYCLGENIADNGGTRAALAAMRTLISADPAQRNPGGSSLEVKWTDDEMFFLSWAHCWCSVYNENGMSAWISGDMDVHSPGFIRTFAPLSNMVEFTQVHSCKTGDFMNPDTQCVLF